MMENYVVGGFFLLPCIRKKLRRWGLQVLLKRLSERILSILWALLQNRGKGVISGGKFSLGWEYKQASLHKMQFRKWFLWTTRIRSLNDPGRKGGTEV